MNLGSVYSQNEYKFDDKVSSVQKDLSLDNCSDDYNSIMNSSDMSNSENNDRVARLGGKVGGLYRDKTKGKLSQGGLGHGMARIKSSVKLFTVDSRQNLDGSNISNDSDCISDLSTGDSAYPVIAFQQRAVKEFEPKIFMKIMNNKLYNLRPRLSRIPTHAKLTYQPPLRGKVINSPPEQSSFEM